MTDTPPAAGPGAALTTMLIVAMAVLTLWAAMRLEVLFELWPQAAVVVPFSNLPQAELDRIAPNGFLGYFGLLDCAEHLRRFDYEPAGCRPIRAAEVGSLKDPMLATGYVVALVGLWLSLWLEPFYRRLTRQLRRDRILPWDDADIKRVEALRHLLSRWVCGVVTVTVAIGFLHFHYRWSWPETALDREHFLSAVVLAAIAGHRLGTAAAMGWLGRTIARRDAELRLILGHVDGMGGARAFGEFLAYQGTLIAIPILFLSAWIAAMVAQPEVLAAVTHWLPTYLALLIISLLISVFSFLLPLHRFASRFRQAKQQALQDWVEKSTADLARLRHQALSDARWSEASAAMEQTRAITEVTDRLEQMPDVPVGLGLRSSLSVTTFAPLILLALELVLPTEGRSFLSLLQQGLGGLIGG